MDSAHPLHIAVVHPSGTVTPPPASWPLPLRFPSLRVNQGRPRRGSIRLSLRVNRGLPRRGSVRWRSARPWHSVRLRPAFSLDALPWASVRPDVPEGGRARPRRSVRQRPSTFSVDALPWASVRYQYPLDRSRRHLRDHKLNLASSFFAVN